MDQQLEARDIPSMTQRSWIQTLVQLCSPPESDFTKMINLAKLSHVSLTCYLKFLHNVISNMISCFCLLTSQVFTHFHTNIFIKCSEQRSMVIVLYSFEQSTETAIFRNLL